MLAGCKVSGENSMNVITVDVILFYQDKLQSMKGSKNAKQKLKIWSKKEISQHGLLNGRNPEK